MAVSKSGKKGEKRRGGRVREGGEEGGRKEGEEGGREEGKREGGRGEGCIHLIPYWLGH